MGSGDGIPRTDGTIMFRSEQRLVPLLGKEDSVGQVGWVLDGGKGTQDQGQGTSPCGFVFCARLEERQ